MSANQESEKPRIAVVGSSNVDFIMQVERLPTVGETVTNANFMQTFGGKGANQAVAAARAGGNVTFVTGLGDDVYAPLMRDNFERDGMVTDYIFMAPHLPSGSALVMFDKQGANYLTVAPGANYALTPAYIDDCAEVIRSAKMLVMQMEIPIPAIERALEIAAERGIPTLLNYAPTRHLEIPMSDKIQILVVNENEASALTGLPVETREQAALAAKRLRNQGPQIVVLTLGAAGAYIAAGGIGETVPAFAVTPVDTTAAGDVFCGAMAVALTEGKPLLEAARFANAASALSVTKPGAQPSIPFRAAIDSFLRDADSRREAV